jgi:hypothetical protein
LHLPPRLLLLLPPQEFNKGLFDYLIATDDVHAASSNKQQRQQQGGDKGKGVDGKGKVRGAFAREHTVELEPCSKQVQSRFKAWC